MNLERLAAADDDGIVHVVIETSKGARNKLKFEPELGTFLLSKVLPAGSVFPVRFRIRSLDQGCRRDPIDVLVLLDEPTPPGCVVRIRLVGVIRAKQAEGRRKVRNDRLIAVSVDSPSHGSVHELQQLPAALVDQIEHCFTS